MKNRIIFVLWFILMLVIFQIGCGQQVPQLNVVSAPPSGLVLRGTVYPYVWTGRGFNFNVGDPFPGAYVKLSGSTGTWSTITNERGEYIFSGIPDGTYNLSVTAEGYLVFEPAAVQIIKPDKGTPDNTITTCDLYFYKLAIITAYSPQPESIISNDQTFTITFSTTMDTSTVRVSLVPQGVRASSVDSGDTVGVDLSWSADKKVLTVTPKGALVSNEVYRLQLGGGLDAWGNPLYANDFSGVPTSLKDLLNYYADYKTAAGGVPSAPSNLQVVINDKPTSEIDFADVNSTVKKVKLNWNAPTSGNISGYKVYVSLYDSYNTYVPLESDSSSSNSTTECYFTSDISKVIKALYGSGASVDPISTRNYPLVNYNVFFKVVAYNGDGESGGSTVWARDVKGPELLPQVKQAPYSGGILTNNYYLPALASNNDVYIAFKEPIDSSSVSKDNFYFSAGGANVNKVEVMTVSTSPLGLFLTNDYSILLVSTDKDLTGGGFTLNVSGVKDLAGNSMVGSISW